MSLRIAIAALGPSLALVALLFAATARPVTRDVRQSVLVVVDTLRADRLGAYSDAARPTPLIDDLSLRGRIYTQAMATSPWTLPSFASMYTGRIPSGHGAGLAGERYVPIADNVPTVAELLSAAGVTTAAIVNNPLLSSSFGVARGFEEYDYDPGTNTVHRRADEMVDRALAWVTANRHASFMLVVHLFDPHMNYDAPGPHRGRYTSAIDSELSLPFDRLEDVREERLVPDEAGRRFISAAYDEEVAFIDAETGRLVEALDGLGFFDEGLLIFTSDHGEELFEHGGFEHGHAMWNQLLHVPLILRGGPVDSGGVRHEAVSVVDVAPTLLEHAGLQIPEGLDGRSLLGPPVEGRALIAESILYGEEQKAIIRPPYKLVWTPSSGKSWVVDDPDETVDLYDRLPVIGPQLEAELLAAISRAPAAEHEAPERLDEDTLERLRSLGYVD